MKESTEFDVNIVFNKPIEIFGYGIRPGEYSARHPRKWSIKFKLP